MIVRFLLIVRRLSSMAAAQTAAGSRCLCAAGPLRRKRRLPHRRWRR